MVTKIEKQNEHSIKASARVSELLEGRSLEAFGGKAARQFGIMPNSSVRAPSRQQREIAAVDLECTALCQSLLWYSMQCTISYSIDLV